MRVAVKEASPIPSKMSEEDGQLIAQYFGAGKEDVWRPSLVAFPRFQLYPSLVYKVPHSFRTTYMLTEAMQQLQDQSFFRTKCEETLQEPAYVAAVKGLQEHEGTNTSHILSLIDDLCEVFQLFSLMMLISEHYKLLIFFSLNFI
ncbi:unnamed protein product [Urochloa humidicola]